MKIRKINGFFWAVIEESHELFVGFGESFREAVNMCLTAKLDQN